VAEDRKIPSSIIRDLISEYKEDYGPTFPLYGKNTVRNDISGSVRPLLAATNIAHESLLAERSGISKRTILKIISGEREFLTYEETDKLLTAMNRADCWYIELSDYR
jgi:hypothetical protein